MDPSTSATLVAIGNARERVVSFRDKIVVVVVVVVKIRFNSKFRFKRINHAV